MSEGKQPGDKPVTVYVSIGNSDDKLSQAEWSDYVFRVSAQVREVAKAVHGAWFSAPDSPYQNACWCAEFGNLNAKVAREELESIRKVFRQESIAWAVVTETEFL